MISRTVVHHKVSHYRFLLNNEPALDIYNILSALLLIIDVGRSGVLISLINFQNAFWLVE